MNPGPSSDARGGPPTGRPPRPYRWPGDARCVVFLGVDLDAIALERGEGLEPLGINSYGVYAYRRGASRYLRLFEKYGVPATFFIPGYDGEERPDLIKAIWQHGYEVAPHGYCHEGFYVEGEEEWRLLKRTHDVLADLMGEPPQGWRNPGGMKSRFTVGYLRRLGYIYDSSDKDFDRPYQMALDGVVLEDMIQLPTCSPFLDDGYLNPAALLPPSEILALWKAEFDEAYHGSGYFIMILHGRAYWGSGTPARGRVLEYLIRYINDHDGVVYMKGVDLARWCLREGSGFSEGPTTRDVSLYRGARRP